VGSAEQQPVIYIISDSLGDSAATVAVAAASQFTKNSCIIHRLPKAAAIEQIAAFVDDALAANAGEIVLLHTITDTHLRAELDDYILDKPVRAVDLIGPAIDAIAEATGRVPKGEPGLIRRTDKQYYERVSALEFAVDHDDGRRPEELPAAQIVLLGVSRSSKTPLSIYLATQGYKVANVPLAAGTQPPAQLFDVDPRRIFGLTTSARLLGEIRSRRIEHARDVAGAYADPGYIANDLDEARALMRRLGCIVVRTDSRAIEETAQEILGYYALSFPAC